MLILCLVVNILAVICTEVCFCLVLSFLFLFCHYNIFVIFFFEYNEVIKSQDKMFGYVTTKDNLLLAVYLFVFFLEMYCDVDSRKI